MLVLNIKRQGCTLEVPERVAGKMMWTRGTEEVHAQVRTSVYVDNEAGR